MHMHTLFAEQLEICRAAWSPSMIGLWIVLVAMPLPEQSYFTPYMLLEEHGERLGAWPTRSHSLVLSPDPTPSRGKRVWPTSRGSYYYLGWSLDYGLWILDWTLARGLYRRLATRYGTQYPAKATYKVTTLCLYVTRQGAREGRMGGESMAYRSPYYSSASHDDIVVCTIRLLWYGLWICHAGQTGQTCQTWLTSHSAIEVCKARLGMYGLVLWVAEAVGLRLFMKQLTIINFVWDSSTQCSFTFTSAYKGLFDMSYCNAFIMFSGET